MDDTDYKIERASHEEVYSLLDALPHAIYECDTDGRMHYHNKAYSDISGYSFEEISGMRVWEFQVPGPAREELPGFLKKLASEQPAPEPYCCKNLTKDGQIIDIQVDWQYKRNASGNVTGFACILSDITDRMSQEQSLKKSEGAYRLLFNSNPNPMLVFEVDSLRILKVNDAAVAQYGYSHEEFLDLTARDIRPEEDIPAAVKAIANAPDGLMPSEGFWRHRKKDGTVIFVEITSCAVEFEGQPARLAMAHDITDRVRAEEALRKSEHRFRNLARLMPEIVFETGPEGMITFTNENAYKVLGYSQKDIEAGFNAMELIVPEHRDRARSNIGRVFAGEDIGVSEYEVLKSDGSRIPVLIHTTRRIEKGEPVGLCGVMVVISERKRMEDDLRQALTDKDLLISEIHHRVKNHLLIVQSLLRLQSGGIEDELSREYLLASEDRIRVISMIHDRLYRSGDPRGLDARDYIEALAVQLYRIYKADVDQIHLEIDVSSEKIDVESAIPCGLIVSELLTNSLKHAFPDGREGTVYIALKKQPDGDHLLSVRDTGVGLPDDVDIEHADSLGMKIVSTLTRQLRGSLDVEHLGGVWVRVRFREKRFS